LKLLSFIAYLFLRLLHATLRVRHIRADHLDNTPRYIVAFWHECVLMSMFSRWRKPTTAMISRSKDGEIVTGVVHRFGIDTARGSSTRGGDIALREILRDVGEGKNIAFTPDGPKGPARVVKEGLVYASKITGLPIVPFHFTARSKKRLRSWDGMIVPRPFSRAVFVYGEPAVVPRDGDVEEWRLKIEKQMNELADEAEVEVNR
jgi:lysophospholipid acyltransferase (LPLAT)-like uncharacterized protein